MHIELIPSILLLNLIILTFSTDKLYYNHYSTSYYNLTYVDMYFNTQYSEINQPPTRNVPNKYYPIILLLIIHYDNLVITNKSFTNLHEYQEFY